MLLTCFVLGVIILIVTGIMVYCRRREFNRAVRIMLIGDIGIITALIFPMYLASYDGVSSLLFSVLYALKALSGGQGVDVSHKVAVEGWLYYGYYALLYLAFVVAPIFTTGFLVSIFGNLMDKLRYPLLTGKVLHVFSELNEGAVLLCKNVAGKKVRVVFCNTDLTAKAKDSELVKRARRFGAVILSRSELDLKVRKKKVFFYQISKSKDYNANTTISLIEKYRDDSTKEVRIVTFSSGVTTELLLDSVDKGNIIVKLLDEVKYSCYSLLDHAPLFEGIRNNKLSALIVGCDYTGMELLKAMLWCGQLDSTEMEINIIDCKAEEREKQFRMNCPSLSPEEHHVNFIQADVRNVDFERALNEHCRDANYIVVATGDDKTNIDTAVYLRKYFLRQPGSGFQNRPKINLRVRDALKNKQMDALSDANIKAYELYAFGSIEKVFSIDNVLGTELELMAKGVHLSYFGALDGSVEEVDAAMESYYRKEYNQRSSFATALRFKYKLYSAGIRGLSGEQISEEQLTEFEGMLQDPAVLERMAMLEHRSWNIFMQTEGYSPATMEDVRMYYATTDKPSHVHYLAKLHPTIAAWEDLDRISEEISAIRGKRRDFKQSDRDIVKKIPAIIRSARQNCRAVYDA